MKGKTKDELFKTFSESAGYVGDLHTPDGVQSLYSIQVDFKDKLYANDTGALWKAFQDHHFIAPNGLYYKSEQQFRDECMEKLRENTQLQEVCERLS